MPTLNVRVMEKWSGRPVPNAKITLNGVQVMSYGDVPLISDNVGETSMELTTGSAKVCAVARDYETACQTLNVVANTSINIIMTPIVRAL